ncbi:MAG: hypothetical protein PVI90_04020, partial [Desulfobacteraceae bacterium]
MPTTGVFDRLIVAIVCAAGKNIWQGLNDPLKDAAADTVDYFYREEDIELCVDALETALTEGIDVKELTT